MKLSLDPVPSIPQFCDELEIVIFLRQGGIPEIFTEEGSPKSDRHLLVGLVQTIAMAIVERDVETVVFMEKCSVRLERFGECKEMAADLVIVKSKKGPSGALIMGDSADAGRLARQAVRWFMGTIRLDVP